MAARQRAPLGFCLLARAVAPSAPTRSRNSSFATSGFFLARLGQQQVAKSQLKGLENLELSEEGL